MAEIAWTDEAQRWLEDIFEYIAADNPRAAERTVQEEILMPLVCTINSCRPRRDRPHAAQRGTARGAV